MKFGDRPFVISNKLSEKNDNGVVDDVITASDLTTILADLKLPIVAALPVIAEVDTGKIVLLIDVNNPSVNGVYVCFNSNWNKLLV
jgi:hypothetical protein